MSALQRILLLRRRQQLIPDPRFDSSGAWIIGAGWAVSGGVATATNTSASIRPSGVLTKIGKRYRATVTVTRSAGTLYLPYDGSGSNALTVTASGIYKRDFVALIEDTSYILGVGFSGTVDDYTLEPIP